MVNKSIFAPLMQSDQGVNSRGEWLIPATDGTKIIPVGQISASDWASWPAPEGICSAFKPSVNAACLQAFFTLLSMDAGECLPRDSISNTKPNKVA